MLPYLRFTTCIRSCCEWRGMMLVEQPLKPLKTFKKIVVDPVRSTANIVVLEHYPPTWYMTVCCCRLPYPFTGIQICTQRPIKSKSRFIWRLSDILWAMWKMKKMRKVTNELPWIKLWKLAKCPCVAVGVYHIAYYLYILQNEYSSLNVVYKIILL